MNNLGNIHVISGLAPADSTTTVTEAYSDVVDAGECTEIEFLLHHGVLTGDTVVIKAYKDANTTAGGGTAIQFRYKLSSATGTDVSGAWTLCASTGYTAAADTDGMILRVNIDPADCDSDYPYCYIGIDPGGSVTTYYHSVTILTVPRYNQSIPPSAVD